MKKFFALLLSACLFISCGINEFSKKSTITFTIPTEALVKLQSQARDVFDVEDYNPDTQNPVVEEVTNGDSGSLTNEVPQTTKFLVYAQLKGSKKGYYKSVFKEVAVSSDDYDNMFARSIIYNNEEIQADNAEISFSDLPVNQTYDIYVDIFSFTNNDDNENVNNIGKCLFTGSKTDVSLNAGDNNVKITMEILDKKESEDPFGLDFYIPYKNDKYSRIGRYGSEGNYKYYFIKYDDDAGGCVYVPMKDDLDFECICNDKYSDIEADYYIQKLSENDSPGEIVPLEEEVLMDDTELFICEFKLGKYFIESKSIWIEKIWDDPEGQEEESDEDDYLYVDDYFNIEINEDEFTLSPKNTLLEGESISYLITNNDRLMVNEIKDMNFSEFGETMSFEVYPYESFKLWLYSTENQYFQIHYIKENDEWTYIRDDEIEYLPISTYFNLMINKDDEGCYPTVELINSSETALEYLSNNPMFVMGTSVGTDTYALETGDAGSYFKYFSNDNLIRKVAFAAKVNGETKYFYSLITRNANNEWYSINDSDLKIDVVTKETPTTVYSSTVYFRHPDFEKGVNTADASSYATLIPLKTLLNEDNVSNKEAILFRLDISDSNFSTQNGSSIFYTLCNGDTIEDNNCYENSIPVNSLYSNGQLTVYLPINPTNSGKEDYYNYILINLQNINVTSSETENGYPLSVNISSKKFTEENIRLFTTNPDSKRFEYQSVIDNDDINLHETGDYTIKLTGNLYLYDWDSDSSSACKIKGLTVELLQPLDYSPWTYSLTNNNPIQVKSELESISLDKKINVTSYTQNVNIQKLQVYTTCTDSSEILILKKYKFEISKDE